MDAFHESCIEYSLILSGRHRSGYRLAVMRSDLIGHSVVWFGYKLVSCTLSRLSHESVGRTGIRPMTLTPMVSQVQLEVNRFSRNVATRKPGPKTHWEKNGPRKGCCHGAVGSIACGCTKQQCVL